MNNIASLSEENPDLKLLVVTKGRSVKEITLCLEKYKLNEIAENRLKEAEEKLPKLNSNLKKHYIGKLQSRKISKIVQLFDVIQTIENLKQAELISEQGKSIEVYIQVNLNRAPGRSGASPAETTNLAKEVQKLPNLKLKGVMGIASQDQNLAREEFKLLKSLQGELKECSMGMSGDYKIAIEEGSTMLRLGRILFEK